MTRDEWVTEFQVLKGRKPTFQEFTEASKNGFQPLSNLSDNKPSKRFSPSIIIKTFIIVFLAVFGYIIGFLFM